MKNKQTKFVSAKSEIITPQSRFGRLMAKTIKGWTVREYIATMGWAILFVMVGSSLLLLSLERAPKTSSKPLGQTIPKVVEVEAAEPKCDDPLSYIRCKGQQLGYDDYTISKFIRIARAESGFNLNPQAKNPRSTATGVYQFIHGTFHAYCRGKNVYDFKDNIDCFFRVLEVDGYPKGLSHWAASKHKWEVVK